MRIAHFSPLCLVSRPPRRHSQRCSHSCGHPPLSASARCPKAMARKRGVAEGGGELTLRPAALWEVLVGILSNQERPLPSSDSKKLVRPTLTRFVISSTVISGQGSKITRLASAQGPDSIEASSPIPVSLAHHPLTSKPLPRRNVLASSSSPKSGNTFSPGVLSIVRNSMRLGVRRAISQ